MIKMIKKVLHSLSYQVYGIYYQNLHVAENMTTCFNIREVEKALHKHQHHVKSIV